MNETLFSLTAMPRSEAPPFGFVNGLSVPGQTATENPSFSELLQQRTPFFSSEVPFSNLPQTTNLPPAAKRQPDVELLSPFLPGESFPLFKSEKFESVVPRGVADSSLFNIAVSQPVENHEEPLTDETRESADDFLSVTGEGNSHEQSGEQENVRNSDGVDFARYAPALTTDQISVPAKQSVREVMGVEKPLAHIKPSSLTSALINPRVHPPLPAQTMQGGRMQETTVENSRVEPALGSGQESDFHSSESIQGRGRLRIPDPVGQLPNQENVATLRQRVVTDRPEHSILSPVVNQAFPPRPSVTSEGYVQPQPYEIPGFPHFQTVSRGSAVLTESGGAGGAASIMNERLTDASATKMELLKVSSEGDRHGIGLDGHPESGLQSGLGGFSQSQSGQQQSWLHSRQMADGVRAQEEVRPEGPTQPLQRLQLDVQISETQRVQIDVGVQHRQVYAGLVMDQLALRNLAMQFVPQLEDQLSNLNLELNQFSAATSEEQEARADLSFQGDKSPSGRFERAETTFLSQESQLSRPIGAAEVGLHFVA